MDKNKEDMLTAVMRQAKARRDFAQAAEGATGESMQQTAIPENGAGQTPVIGGGKTGESGFDFAKNPIGEKQITSAAARLREYKAGKSHLEDKIIRNEEYWKRLHARKFKGEAGFVAGDEEGMPTSGWLQNVIMSKHADAMDAFPEFNILPREESDKAQAELLTSVLPCILEQNDFEETYSQAWWYKLKHGFAVYGVFWDSSKNGGLGDVSISFVDALNIFWEPGVTDLQDSRDIFLCALVDNDRLTQLYPQTKDKLGQSDIDLPKYLFDDNVDTSKKSVVVDWYYKALVDGREIVHFCKFVNNIVLYATENDRKAPSVQEQDPMTGEMVNVPVGQPLSVTGIYDHGLYPFVMDVLYPEQGTPYGFGVVDMCKETQNQIDTLSAAITENAVYNSVPRWFVRKGSGLNNADLSDLSKRIVDAGDADLSEISMRAMPQTSIPTYAVTVLDGKINELKETSGNRDVNNGGTAAGVTAASGIAAMQEQSGKLSRDAIRASYRTYVKLIRVCIELIRQFYSLPRYYRIIGDNGMAKFMAFSNAGMQPQMQYNAMGQETGERLPIYDISVSAQKSTGYNKMSQNELALQFYNAGFFNPQMAPMALMCLDMMDFRGKDVVQRKIAEQYSALMAAPVFPGSAGINPAYAAKSADGETGESNDENRTVEKAREQAQEASVPS